MFATEPLAVCHAMYNALRLGQVTQVTELPPRLETAATVGHQPCHSPAAGGGAAKSCSITVIISAAND